MGGAIGNVANPGASGRGASRSLVTGVPFRTMGRQQSGTVAPSSDGVADCGTTSTAQHELLGTQQKRTMGKPAVKTKIATAREQADRDFAPRRRPLPENIHRA